VSFSRKFYKSFEGWFFAIPGVALYVSIIFIPTIATIGLSFFRWTGLGSPQWIGFKNFKDILFHDWVFREALLHNAEYVLLFLTVSMFIGIATAYITTLTRRNTIIYRIIFYIPVVIASVVSTRVWQWVYNPFVGLTGMAKKVSWLQWLAEFNLGNPDCVLLAVAFADLWRRWGFVFVVYYAALRQIDVQLYESARVEGANSWQIFFYISLPLLRPTIVFTYLLHIIWGFLVFDYVYIMTKGGPGHASELATTWIYENAFVEYKAGYGCALAVYLVCICLIFIAFYVWIKKQGWETAE